MKQENKLKTTLREYYDTQEVPFNDNEWERAAAYLSAARRRRRIRRSLLMVSGIVLTLLISLFSFSKLNTTEKQQIASLSDQKEKSSTLQSSAHLNKPELKTEISVNSNSINEKPKSFSVKKPVTKNQKNFKEKNKLSSHEEQKVFESKLTEQKTNPVVEKQNTKAEIVKNLDSENALLPLVKTKNKVETEQKDSKHETSENYREDKKIASTVSDNSTYHQAESKEDKSTESKSSSLGKTTKSDDKENSKHQAQVNLTRDTEASLEPLENSTYKQDQEKQAKKEFVDVSQPTETVLNENKNNTTKKTTDLAGQDEKIRATAFDTARYSTSEGIDNPIENTEEDTVTRFLNYLAGEGIFYELGAAGYYGWKGPVKRDARGFSPVVGINYMNRISNHCAISFGVQYLQVRNLSNSSKTSRISTYQYGEQSSVTVVTPSTLHYLLAPLRFHYYVDSKNVFGGGVNLAYLLTVDANVTNYDEKPGYKGNSKTVKLSGYTDGFSWFDSQLTLFYRRRITKSLALQAEVFLGLTDVKEDKFFDYEKKERNSGAKLSLIYYAFRKK